MPSTNWPNMNWPNLNWKEIELLAIHLAPELEGLFLERIIVPERPRFPEGYLKGEWVIRFTGRRLSPAFLISIRPRHPYFTLLEGKGPQASPKATRSPFDLAISKQLKGLRLKRFHALPRERVLLMDFEDDLRLVLFLIPSIPEALLVRTPSSQDEGKATRWEVIARSRTLREDPKAAGVFQVPDGSRAPASPEIRKEFTEASSAQATLEDWLDREAFELRIQSLKKELKDRVKTAQDRVRQSRVAAAEAQSEPDWQHYGDLLKASIGTVSETAAKEREVLDYATGQTVKIPCDPKLDLRGQVTKFYQHARRKSRRLSEAQGRIDTFSETISRLEKTDHGIEALDSLDPDWKQLESLERSLGAGAVTSKQPELAKRKTGAWLGKSFESRDGLAIWVGRSRDENLELTFKHARGSDLWLHVRGRPGAHVVVPVQPGKSVPLETLLDAANLVIYYSGGESWGKTEVDYTFKKYVKRIKDSTEASYTNNKTLIIEPDRVRLKRLLGSEA
jgi:hypothetical protein